MKIIKRNKIIIAIVILLFFVIFYGISQHKFYQSVKIVVDAKIELPDTYQLYYDTGKGFSEEESVKVSATTSNNFQSIVFNLPLPPTIITKFRIDTGYVSKNIDIKQISIKTVKQTLSWNPQEILNEFDNFFDFSITEVRGDVLHLETSGGDPQFVYAGDISSKIDMSDVINTEKKTKYLVVFSILFIIILTVLFLFKKNIAKK